MPLILLVIACVFMYQPPAKMLPVKKEVFVGRETELEVLTNWIGNSTTNIISIVGSPGFGKSTLAIHVGHEITAKGGVAVLYADLYKVQDMTTLYEKLAFLVLDEKKRSSEDDLLMWAHKLKVPTLLIFDNCDELLHKNKDPFQILINNLVGQSQFLKVMLTAKQMTSFLDSFRNFTLRELTLESAANVLQKLSNSLNRTAALEIAKLVGNVPLALQVVGSLLKDIHPSIIANDLKRDLIPALSSELLPSTGRVYTSLNISYHYLSPEHQKCGRLLALFPGSFDANAVKYITEGRLLQDPSKCLKELCDKSLLSYDGHTQRYRYHQLIQEFFVSLNLTLQSLTVEQEQFSRHFVIYYATLYFEVALPPVEANYRFTDFQTLDAERMNFEYVFTLQSSIRKHSNVFDTFSDASNTHLQQLITLADLLINLKYLHVPLEEYCQYLKSTLMQYDMQFALISNHTGKSASFEVYVNLLIRLSKIDGKVDGQSHRSQLQTLLSRSKRVEELYHLARTDDSISSRMVYAKYYSEVTNSYMHYGKFFEQFNPFLQHWKSFIQLKWPLAQCKQVGCTPTQLALAHFGQGDYEQSVKHLETLLHSKSLRGNRRVWLFILLHESYMRLGEVEKASHLLTKDHLLSKFQLIKTINATDHRFRNSTVLSILYNGNQADHSGVWLLDQECTTISSKNYKTCKILAAFYNSLGSKEATTLGRVLNRVRHHFKTLRVDMKKRWWNHEVYSSEGISSDGRNIFVLIMVVVALII